MGKKPEMTFGEILDYSSVVLNDKSEFKPTHIFLNQFDHQELVELRNIVIRRSGRYDGQLVCIYRFRFGDMDNPCFGAGMCPKDEFDAKSRLIREPEMDSGVMIADQAGQAMFIFLGVGQ